MTTEELIKRARRHLDDDEIRFPDDETIENGLNPAQDLVALLKGHLRHTHRFQVPARTAFVNLCQVDPHIFSVEQVLLGKQDADRLEPDGLGGLRQLDMTTVESLAGQHPGWYTDLGMPRRYYMHGRSLLGFWPRPPETVTVTLQALSIPSLLQQDETWRHPELDAVEHELIADVAAPLLLVKEGAVEVDKALTRLNLLLGHEAFNKMLQKIRRQAREWPAKDPQHQAAI